MKKALTLLLALTLGITMLTGCDKNNAQENQGKESSEVQQVEESQDEITDMLGRKVKVKMPVTEKIIANNPGAMRIFLYVSDVDKLCGVPDREKKDSRRRPYALANPKIQELPSFGQTTGGSSSGTSDYEALLALKPNVIFTVDEDVDSVNKMQEKLQIPVIALSYGDSVLFDQKLYDSINLIGKVTGEEKRAEEVVKYMESIKTDLNDRTKDIKDEDKLSAYAGGLAWKGSHGIESTREDYPMFEAVNAKNVVNGVGKSGSVMIDKEKLLQWNPDVVFIDLASFSNIQEDYRKNPKYYESLEAFKNGNVYTQLPYVWCMVNMDTAMADAYYVGKILYPEQFKDVDPKEKADEIYEFLVGEKVYDKMAADDGGFQKITLDDLKNMEV